MDVIAHKMTVCPDCGKAEARRINIDELCNNPAHKNGTKTVRFVPDADHRVAIELLRAAMPHVFDWAVEGNENAAKLVERIDKFLDTHHPGGQ